MPDLWQVLVLLGRHPVHSLVVQHHNLVDDLSIVADDVCTRVCGSLRGSSTFGIQTDCSAFYAFWLVMS